MSALSSRRTCRLALPAVLAIVATALTACGNGSSDKNLLSRSASSRLSATLDQAQRLADEGDREGGRTQATVLGQRRTYRRQSQLSRPAGRHPDSRAGARHFEPAGALSESWRPCLERRSPGATAWIAASARAACRLCSSRSTRCSRGRWPSKSSP